MVNKVLYTLKVPLNFFNGTSVVCQESTLLEGLSACRSPADRSVRVELPSNRYLSTVYRTPRNVVCRLGLRPYGRWLVFQLVGWATCYAGHWLVDHLSKEALHQGGSTWGWTFTKIDVLSTYDVRRNIIHAIV